MSITYHTTLPDYAPGTLDETGEFLHYGKGKPVWSNDKAPPAIGDRVRIRVNGIGMATVDSYFEQDGFLGVKTTVDAWPAPFNRNQDADHTCHAFGAEIA